MPGGASFMKGSLLILLGREATFGLRPNSRLSVPRWNVASVVSEILAIVTASLEKLWLKTNLGHGDVDLHEMRGI